MKIYRQFISKSKDQSGVTAIVVGIMIAILIGFTALAVDVGYVMTTRNELQNVSDSAALAAARQLGAIYQGMSYDQQQNYVCDPSTIQPIARDVGLMNQAGGTNITINDADIIIGRWDPNTRTLNPTLSQPDAVKVAARRDGSANGPITTFFARILGIDTVDVGATATAALTGQGTSEPGELELPVGISSFFFTGYGCNEHITFSPTNDPESCAGWTSWDYNPNDITIRRILDEQLTSPGTQAGVDSANFIGGDLSTPTFNELLLLFMRKGYDYNPNTGEPINRDPATGEPVSGHLGNEGVPLYAEDGVTRLYYPDGPDYTPLTPRNYHKWETKVVVYEWDDCSNPNTSIRIVGYTPIELTDVLGPPDKLLRGKVMCELVSNEDNRGGGGYYGVKGSIPGLVE